MEEKITHRSAGFIQKIANPHSSNVKLFFLVLLMIENNYSVHHTKEMHRDSNRNLTDGKL